jgi:glycosyltransferase involved in cell wall biosynthesis
MKIVICISRDSEQSGGSFRMAEVAIRALVRQGLDVHAVIGYGPGRRIKRLLDSNCHLINSNSWGDLRGWMRLRMLLTTLAPDVIHFASASNWMVAATLGMKPARIMHQHFRPSIGPNAYKHIRGIKWRMIGSQRVIAISHGAARQLVTLCGIPESKVSVIHNAIDTGYLTSASSQRGDVRRLGMAIRIVEDKGVEDALTLIALLPNEFHLTVAGDGPDLKRFKSLAERKGISHRVEWLGLIESIDSFYSAIDYYLYLSWYEGFGLSVAEAMSCGVPVVGLLGDGEIAEPEFPLVTSENSRLVPRSSRQFCRETNAETFANLRDAILELDRDNGLRDRLVQNAKAWISERFSSDDYGRRLYQLYRDAIKSV